MSITLLMVCLLLGTAWAILLSLFRDDTEEPACTGALTVLPVPEDTPDMRMFLRDFAAQILWTDARVLQCVILVCTPESETLCRDMARDHSCFAVMTPAEVQTHIAGLCRANCGKS